MTKICPFAHHGAQTKSIISFCPRRIETNPDYHQVKFQINLYLRKMAELKEDLLTTGRFEVPL